MIRDGDSRQRRLLERQLRSVLREELGSSGRRLYGNVLAPEIGDSQKHERWRRISRESTEGRKQPERHVVDPLAKVEQELPIGPGLSRESFIFWIKLLLVRLQDLVGRRKVTVLLLGQRK